MDTKTFEHLTKVKLQTESTIQKLNKIEEELTKDNFVEKIKEIKALVKSLEIRVFQGFDAMFEDLIERTKEHS